MKKITLIPSIFSIPFKGMKLKNLSIAFLLFIMASPNLWSQDKHANCTHECYTEPDYTTEITVKLPYADTPTNVTVDIRDGIAYYQGDIILGKLTDILQKGVGIDTNRWTNSTIPYSISSNFGNSQDIQKIHDAAAIISDNTNLCVIPRNGETNYLYIFPSNNGINASTVGMLPGSLDNNLELSGNFSVGIVIHELLHAAGIYHEQSREDRDNHVIIHTENIKLDKEHNFEIAPIETSTDYGAYDFASIMHYPSYAFSRNGLPTITRKINGTLITQTDELSQGDIATINSMYPIPCGGGISPTTCQSTVSSFPYSESFEFGNNSWSPITANTSSCTGDWAKNEGNTGSPDTGPAAANDGNYYLYTEASSPCSNTTMTIESPCFDLSNLSSPTLTFDYHMYGASMGTLALEISVDDGNSWTELWSQTGDQGNAWHTANLNLSSYTSGAFTLRFKGTTGNDYRSDMAIDNLNIQGSNSCPFTAGTACDDGDICTINDVYDSNCNCIGTTITGIECPPPSSYCSLQGNSNSEFIESVQIGTITNTSGNDGGYGDYTANTPFNIVNFDTPITLTPGFKGGSYSENWKIWVDINKDGDFEDAGEEVFSGTSVGTSPLSGTIKVPSANNVQTTMRIAMEWKVEPTSCGTIKYGEAEDYTVNLSTVSGKSVAESNLVQVYPNPAKHYINVNIHDIISGSNLQSVNALIYTMEGKQIYSETLNASSILTINTQDLPEASYILRLQTDDGRAFVGKFLKL